jgi:hypothetical protein
MKKKLLIIIVSIVSFMSCQKESVDEMQNSHIINAEKSNLATSCNSNNIGPTASNFLDYLNCLSKNRLFTHSRYMKCSERTYDLSLSSSNSLNITDSDGPLASFTIPHVYTYTDFSNLVSLLWTKVRDFCKFSGTNPVIEDVTFYISVVNGIEYINADVIVCCYPQLNPPNNTSGQNSSTLLGL